MAGPVGTALWGMPGIDRLREALILAGYTRGGIADRLGPQVAEAVDRGDPWTALRTCAEGDRLGTLLRLFACHTSEPTELVAAALAPLSLPDALAAGLIEPEPDSGGRLRAGLRLSLYRDWWVLADLPGPTRPDHVLGVNPVGVQLAGATVRHPVGTALDIGTGAGMQALHFSAHATRVTATDISPRALRFAAANAALNNLDWELLHGDMTTPVEGRRFDLVVANPPFIIGPGHTHATHLYRDSGRPGDQISAELAAAAPTLLTEGGYLQYLANWAHIAGQNWTERLASWVEPTGCDAWILQRSTTDPARYITQWLRETGHHNDPTRQLAWLDYFDTHHIEAVGSGLITLRRTDHTHPTVRIEDYPHAIDGTAVLAWFDRQDWLQTHDPLTATYTTPTDLHLTQEATRNGHGWHLQRQLLTHTQGLHCTVEVDPLIAALTAACDPTRPLRDHLARLSSEHHLNLTEVETDLTPALAHLIERGILTPTTLHHTTQH